LSGWLIRNGNELAGELTELYDCKPLFFYGARGLVFCDEQAAVFKIGPAEQNATPWKVPS